MDAVQALIEITRLDSKVQIHMQNNNLAARGLYSELKLTLARVLLSKTEASL